MVVMNVEKATLLYPRSQEKTIPASKNVKKEPPKLRTAPPTIDLVNRVQKGAEATKTMAATAQNPQFVRTPLPLKQERKIRSAVKTTMAVMLNFSRQISIRLMG